MTIVTFCPRGYAVGTYAQSLAQGPAVGVEHIELAPPVWLARRGVKYPGWSRHFQLTELPPNTVDFQVRSVRLGLLGISSEGKTTARGSIWLYSIDGIMATPKNAPQLFDSVMRNMFTRRPFGVRAANARGCA